MGRALLLLWWGSAGLLPGQWWTAEPLRILDLGTSFGRIASPDPAGLAARKVALGYHAEHLHVMGMQAGLDDQRWYFVSKVSGKQNEDYLGRYLPEAQRRGLRVMIYFNVHWYTREFGRQHPEWLQVRENGRPYDTVYETGTDFCVNSPWREWVFQVLRDLAAYPIDGIFFDGPIFFPDTCYCRWCEAKFGGKLPSKRQRQGADFARLVEFQARSLAEFLRDSRRVLRSVREGVAFYMNGGVRGSNWATGRLNRVLAPEQDILGSEGGFISGDLTRVPLWKPGVTARLLETQAPDKPRVIFSAASHKPWTFSLLPAAELRLLYAGTVANAAGVWFGVTEFDLDQPEMEALADLNRFVAANARYYKNTRSEARTALVWSDTTANFYAGADAQLIDIDRVPQRSEVGNLDGEFSGLAEALVRSHTPFDVLDDTALEREDLGRYQLVMLPNVAAMSERAAGRLRDWVAQGGTLFASFETSLYDQTGVRRGDFALAEVFGVSDGRKIVGPNRWDFVKPAGARHPLLDGVTREWIPAPAYHLKVALKEGQPVLWFTQPLKGRYDGIPPVSEEAALVVRSYGKGRAVYSSGDWGNAINGFRLAEHLQVITNLAVSPVQIENAPASVEVVLRSQEQGRRLLLHLINSTGEMTRPMRRVMPLSNVGVRLEGTVRRVHTLRGRQELKPGPQFVVPRVEDYEVVVVER